MAVLFDSHAHLDFRNFDPDREEVLARAAAEGVRHIITIGSGEGLRCQEAAIKIAQAHENIWATVGVHPHDARLMDDTTLGKLRDWARRDKVVALGEIGLDFAKMHSPRETQLQWFRAQLALARELALPVVIHDRDAHAEMMEIFKQDGIGPAGGIMHCYSGDPQMAAELVRMGFYISFSGTLTYKTTGPLQRTAAETPLDRILVETDCPFLSPQPRRGQRNEPSFVRFTAESLAVIRRLNLETLAEATTANTFRAFRIKP
jgi:TatD DNase family protein